MANTTKVTKKDNFTAIYDFLKNNGQESLATVMEHELELLEKKSNSGGKKTNKTAKINAQLKERVLEMLQGGDSMTATQIMKGLDISGIEGLAELSLPKITRLLTDMGKVDKTLDRSKDKKGATFKIGTGNGFEKGA
jgi:hypothetical protein